MPDVPYLAAKGQDLVTRAVDAAAAAADSVRATVKEKAPALERVADLVPNPSDVVDQVTATANELLTLSQDIQNKVIAALKSNA